MTRRKDPQPESLQPEIPPVDPFVAEVDPMPAVPPAPTVEADPVSPPQSPPPGRPGIVAPLFGGALAAIGGFALSHFNVLGLSADPSALAALGTRLDEAENQQATAKQKLGADLAELAGRVAALESAPAPAAADLSRLDALDQRLAALEAIPTDGRASTPALTAKVAELEKRLATLPSGTADPALQQKLDDALARLAAAESAAAARAAEAEAVTQSAARAKALDALAAAIETGQPFVAELQALNDPALATTLASLAETGVPNLTQLQSAFPDAAREVLRLSRDLSAEDGWGDRLVDFLAAQTGARPLTPLEGDTPDALLSRAEFALSEGHVTNALAELDALDSAVKAPLDPWIARAKAHLAAAAALQAARGE